MRIIGGRFKKKRLHPPAGIKARPTTDQAREGLFNILQNRMNLEDITVLDLYAGTGSVSLEFASRGAGLVTAVDKDPKATRSISKMTEEMELSRIHIERRDVREFLKKAFSPYDVIFADPPYNRSAEAIREVRRSVEKNGLLKKAGLMVMEHEGRTEPDHSDPWFLETRNFGRTRFSFWSPTPEDNDEKTEQ